ncbi:hypothetical protein GOBAR_AA07380 [Gossypium barbadense]|uniref:Uncharacterized protein n=1 Tax=Gossypium barbadense TaxID=3634 RepID=A0A2P5YCD1_GOSBA|nr:hypothetical protein GOBAR_AA07380 [Gossypium barbadense]
MVVDPLPVPSLSWKDMLVGKESFVQNNTSDRQSFADNFSLIEQDVKKSFIDGVPSIDFSERVYQLLEKELSTFVNTDDYDKIHSQGLWVIFSHYLTVQTWTIDFNPKPYPSCTVALA